MRHLLLLAICSSPVLAADWDLDDMLGYDKWKGFKPGSMVHTRITRLAGGRKMVIERKETLKEVRADEYIVLVEMSGQGRTEKREERVPRHKVEIKVDSTGQGSYMLRGGSPLPCNVREVRRIENGGTDQERVERVKVWEHSRFGVLAMEIEIDGRKFLTRLSKLDVQRKISGRHLQCRAYETKGPDGVRGASVMCTAVPDRTVSREFRKGEAGRMVELLAYVRKR